MLPCVWGISHARPAGRATHTKNHHTATLCLGNCPYLSARASDTTHNRINKETHSPWNSKVCFKSTMDCLFQYRNSTMNAHTPPPVQTLMKADLLLQSTYANISNYESAYVNTWSLDCISDNSTHNIQTIGRLNKNIETVSMFFSKRHFKEN